MGPILVAVIYALFTLDLKNAFQIWLSVGVFCTMVLIFMWFVCSIIESYIRIFRFLLRGIVDKHFKRRLSRAANTEEGNAVPIQEKSKGKYGHAVTPSDATWLGVE